MSKNSILRIDTRVWITQKALATEKGVDKSTVSAWIARGKVVSWRIPELNITLVRRP